ncbi:hypothetical protein JCM11641_007800 [Rhodosporidiobolus odoratus]
MSSQPSRRPPAPGAPSQDRRRRGKAAEGHAAVSLIQRFNKAWPEWIDESTAWKKGLKKKIEQECGEWSVLDRATVNEVGKEMEQLHKKKEAMPDLKHVFAMFPDPQDVVNAMDGPLFLVDRKSAYQLVVQAGRGQQQWIQDVENWIERSWGLMNELTKEGTVDILAEEASYNLRGQPMRPAAMLIAQLDTNLTNQEMLTARTARQQNTQHQNSAHHESSQQRPEAPHGQLDPYGLIALDPRIYDEIEHVSDTHTSRSLGKGPEISDRTAERYGTTKARWEARWKARRGW